MPDPTVVKYKFPFIIFIIFSFIVPAKVFAQSCNNWLYTPAINSKVTIGDLDVIGDKITVEGMFNITGDPSLGIPHGGKLVSKLSGPADVNYAIFSDGCEITTTGSGYKALFCCLPERNKTYHVAMVYDGATLKLYRNGFLMAQTPCTGQIVTNDIIATIGYLQNPTLPAENQFSGHANEIRIWNVARTQAQINAYMNSSLPNPATQPGLLAYYTFDNLLNKQGNATWDGILSGGATINQVNPNCTFIRDSCEIVVAPQERIINEYTEAISFETCKNILTVADASKYNVGDTVLLIQMKGAGIDSTNTNNFGTINNYASAGNYEFNYIKSKNGNAIELLNTVQRQYDLEKGKVQLIRVPYFQNYITDAKLTSLQWDGGKGGVLAFNVQNVLELTEDLDVSGKGFRGGSPLKSTINTCNAQAYFYNAASNNGGQKGEGIHTISDAKNFGRGSPANGGGGGNAHNSGGGGGSNAGAGGHGGDQWEGCKSLAENVGGVGGKALTNTAVLNKVYLGGGGGMGHGNDNNEYSGGNGGGIIIVSAGSIITNGHAIKANGADAPTCSGTVDCNDGVSGAGGGGTVLLNINTATGAGAIEAKGGKGADSYYLQPGNTAWRVGPGGGGGGGFILFQQPAIPASFTTNIAGGLNGVSVTHGNVPYGATSGNNGTVVNSFPIIIDQVSFKANIDSVTSKAIAISCNTFNLTGMGYVNTHPISSWHWDFGNGASASTQNTTYTYPVSGNYTIKLIVTDANGCKDSVLKNVQVVALNFDFNYVINACNPLTVDFAATGTTVSNPYWNFGDGNIVTGVLNPSHTYAAEGDYTVRYSVADGVCTDTLEKTISVRIVKDDIIITRDTVICYGASIKLLATPSANFCWYPAIFLDNPAAQSPVSTPTQNVTYYYTAEIKGANVIVNGDFSSGNSGFSSTYLYSPSSGVTEGSYNVGNNIPGWHASLSACTDHTSGNGNMMMVNGASVSGVPVWSQTVTVQPNTNYSFSAWLQNISAGTAAKLQFSINGQLIGNDFDANTTACTWKQFNSTWNSGSGTSAIISIVNKNTSVTGNDFALDDISFAPVTIKRDSVKITIDSPLVRTNNDTTVCANKNVQLNATGAASYIWTPSQNLSQNNIQNPVASPFVSTQYIVTGTTVNGCTGKDTVNVNVFAKPAINISNDTVICKNTSVQLFVSGGAAYSWLPATGLSNPLVFNPIASPVTDTRYYVNITDVNNCAYQDSVNVTIKPDAVFSVSAPGKVCSGDSVQLTASGGDIYSWQPLQGLSNSSISNPKTSPVSTTNYSVTITESVCNQSATLNTVVTVLELPVITASKSNDIDCSNGNSVLSASGNAAEYSWSPSSSLSNPSIYNPVATPALTTQYIVTGKNADGCKGYDTITVNVENTNMGGYLMPNAFTPNNDGKNDCYGISHWGIIEKVEFSIYNRWGELIFYSKDPNRCWDGTYKGVKQDTGVFVYMIKAKTSCAAEVFRKGTFTLIR